MEGKYRFLSFTLGGPQAIKKGAMFSTIFRKSHQPRLGGIALLFGIVLGVAGCATSAETRLLAEEPNFTRGFADGCITGRETDKSFSTKRERDAYLFDNDKAYRAGWRQGFLECGDPEERRDRDYGGVVLGNENDF